MPKKIQRDFDVKWTEEEEKILQAALDLCEEMSQDEDMEEWARENCAMSFYDVARGLCDFIGQSI